MLAVGKYGTMIGNQIEVIGSKMNCDCLYQLEYKTHVKLG